MCYYKVGTIGAAENSFTVEDVDRGFEACCRDGYCDVYVIYPPVERPWLPVGASPWTFLDDMYQAVSLKPDGTSIWNRIGFQLSHNIEDGNIDGVAFPLWCPFLITALLPVLWLIRRLRKRDQGLCAGWV